jgi:hypothetical protein
LAARERCPRRAVTWQAKLGAVPGKCCSEKESAAISGLGVPTATRIGDHFGSWDLKSIMGCRESKRALCSELFRQMTMHRCSLVSGTRHRPYRGHAERWLEFLVRIDVTSVDSALGPRLLSQVLKDWLRVQRHLEQGDFARYFSGVELQSVPPMVCLVAPALRFQPATAILLRYLSPQAEAARVGLAESRRRGRCVVLRQ